MTDFVLRASFVDGIGNFLDSIGSLVTIVVDSITSFFTVLASCINTVLSFVVGLPNVVEYGITVFIGVTVSVIVIDVIKGLV